MTQSNKTHWAGAGSAFFKLSNGIKLLLIVAWNKVMKFAVNQ
jgi:hypothetical protein